MEGEDSTFISRVSYLNVKNTDDTYYIWHVTFIQQYS